MRSKETMKVNVDWALCDANGVCVVEAPRVFEMTDDELVVLPEEVAPEDLGAVKSAIRVCPKRALSLSE
jgi:ferredoxin